MKCSEGWQGDVSDLHVWCNLRRIRKPLSFMRTKLFWYIVASCFRSLNFYCKVFRTNYFNMLYNFISDCERYISLPYQSPNQRMPWKEHCIGSGSNP